MRPPSLGFTYLLLAIAAFVAFFVYLRQPMWWQAADARTRDLAEANYLVRIAEDGAESRRGEWLSDAMNLAGRHADWDLCERIFDLATAQKLDLRPSVVRELHAGTCWAIGLGNNSSTTGPGSAALLLRGSDKPQTLRTTWSADRKGALEQRLDGSEWQQQPLQAKGEANIEVVIAAGSRMRLEVRGAASMFPKKHHKRQPGVRLVSSEVQQ